MILPSRSSQSNATSGTRSLHAAASAFSGEAVARDDSAASPDDELNRRKSESLECLVRGGLESRDLCVASVDAPLRSNRPREVEHKIRVGQSRQSVEVALVDSGVSRPHDLHVLL